MYTTRLLKKFIMPCGLCAAVPAIKSVVQSNDSPSNDEQKLVRPSELPVYAINKGNSKTNLSEIGNKQPNAIEEEIGKARRSVSGFFSQFTDFTDSVKDKVSTGIEHSKMTLEYLREEENILPRIGAIGVGGLSGLILSLRGGRFKRLLYTSSGALIVAAVIYPKEAKETAISAKYYISIGYNFLYGIKPEDGKPVELPWPEIPKVPTTLTEFTELLGHSYNWVASGVGTLVGKTTEVIVELKEDKKADGNKSKGE